MDFLVRNVNDIGYLCCRVGFCLPVSGPKAHHKTAEALGQVTWCGFNGHL